MKNNNMKWFVLPMLTVFTLGSPLAMSLEQGPAVKATTPAAIGQPATAVKAGDNKVVSPAVKAASQEDVAAKIQRTIEHRAKITQATKLAKEAAKNREPYSIRSVVKNWDMYLANFQKQLKSNHTITFSRKTAVGKIIPLDTYQYAPQAASKDAAKKTSAGFSVKPTSAKAAEGAVLSPIVSTVFQQISKNPSALESMFDFYPVAVGKDDGVHSKFLALPKMESLLNVKYVYVSLNQTGNVMSVELATPNAKYVYGIQ